MSVTFQKYHVYNKVFFLDSNKLAFYPPFIISLPVGLFWPSPSIRWLQDRMVHKNAYHLFFDRLSFRRF